MGQKFDPLLFKLKHENQFDITGIRPMNLATVIALEVIQLTETSCTKNVQINLSSIKNCMHSESSLQSCGDWLAKQIFGDRN
jgi:hypothetical protein